VAFISLVMAIQVHGHRGARAVLPENTLPAFEYAIQAGAGAIELDLAVTRDDVLVASHDPVLPRWICSGGAGTRVIRQMTLAELKRWDCGARANPRFPRQKALPGATVPSIDEVFALAPRGKFLFNLETKIFADRPQYTPSPERFAALLVEAVRRHRLESRVIVQSFDFRTLKAMKTLAPEIRLAALDEAGAQDFVATARLAGAGIISPHLKLVSREKVEAAHAAGLQVVPWTANTPRAWRLLIEAGVDGIITDDPAALIEYLKRFQARLPLQPVPE